MYVKIYWGIEGNYTVSIRTNFYSQDLAYIQDLVRELREDHPCEVIADENIRVVIYNTPRFKGMMGVEYSTENPNIKKYSKCDAPCLY